MDIFNIIKHPRASVVYFLNHHCPMIVPDKIFLQQMYADVMGKELDLKDPQSYTEKLQWLKLYDRRPEYTMMVDKCEVKKYVAEKIGMDHIVPTLAVYDCVEDIDFEKLPNKFVLKCTHDSGGIIICRDKMELDRDFVIRKLKNNLKENFYYQSREWPYKHVRPRIIAEKYIEDGCNELADYKWFCFNGQPKMMFIATDRFNKKEETKFDFFDMDFIHLPFTNGHPNSERSIEKPVGFEKMKELSRKISAGIPHVRVDFYDVNGHIYFGEITFFHWSGMVKFDPPEWDYKIGSWIELPKNRV